MVMPAPYYDDDGWPMMQWFGESWGAPVCDQAHHAETPIGAPCAELCGDSIEPEDQGFLIPLLQEDEPPILLAHHLACWRRSILGPAQT